MSFWDALLALNPGVLWKVDDAAVGNGAVILDHSGNGRNGTVQNTGGTGFAKVASIIPNRPDDGAVKATNAGNAMVRLASASWMDATNASGFWAAISYRPSAESFTTQRDIFGRQNMWQLWQETSRKVTAYTTPAWTGLLSNTALNADQDYFIVLRKIPGEWSIWINGVKDAAVVHSGNPTASGGLLLMGGSVAPTARPFRGTEQGMAYGVGIITDQQIIDAYAVWLEQPVPPSDPTGLGFQVFSPSLVNAFWEASTMPGGGAVTYNGEYWDGAAWQSAWSGVSGLTYDWAPPTAVRGRDDVRLRVQARGETGGTSNWIQTDPFSIPALAPENIVVNPGTELTEISWELTTNADGEYWDGLAWRVLFTDLDAEMYDWDTSRRKGASKVRIRSRDGFGVTGAWVESDSFDLTGRFVGSLWRALLSFPSLAVLWKLNDGGAEAVQDHSGHGRHATAQLGITQGHPSIIYNRPGDTSVRIPAPFGSGTAVGHDGGDWYAGLRTGLIFCKADTDRAGIGSSMINCGGVWATNVQAGSQTKMALVLAGTGTFNIPADYPPAPGTFMVAVALEGPGADRRAAVYFNDTNVYAARHNLSATVPGQWGVIPRSSTDTYWQGSAAFSEELDALEVAWVYRTSLNEPNELPSLPVFTSPAAGDYDAAVPLAWTPSVDPEGSAVEYYGEYWDPEALVWAQLFDWQTETTFDWDVSAAIQFPGYKVRIKARDVLLEETDWIESATFNVVHARTAPDTPWLEWVGETDQFLYFWASPFVSSVSGASVRRGHWRIATDEDMTNIVGQWTSSGPNYRLGHNPWDLTTGDPFHITLFQNTDYWVDVRWEDEIGVYGSRSAPVRGRTGMAVTGVRYIFARDLSGNERHGTYGLTTGNDGASFLNLGAGILGNRFPGHLLQGAPSRARGFKGVPFGKVRWQGKLYEADPADPLRRPIPDPGNIPEAVTGHWAVFIRAMLLDGSVFGRGWSALMGFRTAVYQPGPIMSGGRGIFRLSGQSLFFLPINYPYYIPLATMPVGEMITLRIAGKEISPAHREAFEATSGIPGIHQTRFFIDPRANTSIVTVNGVCVFDSQMHNDQPPNPFDPDPPDPFPPAAAPGMGWIEFGHGAGSPETLQGSYNAFPGVVVEGAIWSHPDMSVDTNEMPWLHSAPADPSPSTITNSPELRLYYRFDDPTPPTKPIARVG